MAGVLVLTAGPAAASCADDLGPSGSPVIFVGDADQQRAEYSRFQVVEVWAGPELAPEVWVLSGQERPPWPLSLLEAGGSSSDAEFVDGHHYLVGASDGFGTGACTVREATADTHRRGAREPVEGGATGADPPMAPALRTVGVVGVVVGLIGAVRLWRRRRMGRR